MEDPKIVIGIVAHNNEDCLMECLTSVYGFTAMRDDTGYVLVDNASTDDTASIMDDFVAGTRVLDRQARCLHLGNNVGCNEGWNYMFQECVKLNPNPEWLILLNSDIQILRENWVGELLECVKDDVAVVEALGVIHHPGGQLQHVGSAATLYRFSALYELWAEEEARHCQLGPWDVKTFPGWEGDIDVFNALRARGWWPALAMQGVHVLHLCGRTESKIWGDKLEESQKAARAVLVKKWDGNALEKEWWGRRNDLGCIESLCQFGRRTTDADRLKELYPWL